MWDHFRSQAFRSEETLNAENKILKEIVSRQRKKLLLLARQISQIESKSRSKNQPTSPPVNLITVNETAVSKEDVSEKIMTEIEDECSIVAVKNSVITDIPRKNVADLGKSANNFSQNVQKGTNKKRSSDGDLKIEEPPKKRRSNKRTSTENKGESSDKIAEKLKSTNLEPVKKGSPPKIRRSSRTIRQKSPEIEVKVSSPKINTITEKAVENPPKKLVCRWQKVAKNSNQLENCNSECKKSFGSINALHKHLQSHVPSWVAENATFVCYWNGCKRNQKAYSGRIQLISHFSQHTV